MQKYFLLAGLAFAALIIASCSTNGARTNMEYQLNRDIGKFPGEAFKNILGVDCGDQNGEAGCLRVDKYYDCRVLYKLDKLSGKISGWEYAGRPENCWGYHGH